MKLHLTKKAAIFFTSIIAFTIFSFSSCTPHFYNPKPLEPALLDKKDQLKINAVADRNMSAISVAYSPRENVGLQIGTGTKHYKSSGTSNAGASIIYLNENYFNPYVSLGYYKKISSGILFESYGGVGVYNYKNTATAYLKKMNSLNFFVQPSVAYLSENLEAAFTLRVDYLGRGKTIVTDSVLTADVKSKYNFLNYTNYFFIQPGIVIKAGVRQFKFQLQVPKVFH